MAETARFSRLLSRTAQAGAACSGIPSISQWGRKIGCTCTRLRDLGQVGASSTPRTSQPRCASTVLDYHRLLPRSLPPRPLNLQPGERRERDPPFFCMRRNHLRGHIKPSSKAPGRNLPGSRVSPPGHNGLDPGGRTTMAAARAETPSDPVCDTQDGYFWYICTWTTPYYSGCCGVDPCNQEPFGCPASATGEPIPDETTVTITSNVPASTLTITKTAQHTSPSASLSTPLTSSRPTSAPGAVASTIPTISPTSAATNDGGSGHGLTISVGALVGIVLACGIVAIFGALSACMWWGRRRPPQKDEKSEQVERAVSSRGMDEGPLSPGLESSLNSTGQGEPGGAFGQAEEGSSHPCGL